jgi:hypothetical protein
MRTMIKKVRPSYSGGQQGYDFFESPHMICNASSHRGRFVDALVRFRKRSVGAAKVVVHEVERHGESVILDLLGKRVGQARKAAHRHTHRKVRPLDVGGRYQVHVRAAHDRGLYCTRADCGTVAALPFLCRRQRVGLNKLGEIGTSPTERVFDCRDVAEGAIRRDLNAVGEARSNVMDEGVARVSTTRPDQPRDRKFGLGINSGERPNIADAFLSGVPLLRWVAF